MEHNFPDLEKWDLTEGRSLTISGENTAVKFKETPPKRNRKAKLNVTYGKLSILNGAKLTTYNDINLSGRNIDFPHLLVSGKGSTLNIGTNNSTLLSFTGYKVKNRVRIENGGVINVGEMDIGNTKDYSTIFVLNGQENMVEVIGNKSELNILAGYYVNVHNAHLILDSGAKLNILSKPTGGYEPRTKITSVDGAIIDLNNADFNIAEGVNLYVGDKVWTRAAINVNSGSVLSVGKDIRLGFTAYYKHIAYNFDSDKDGVFINIDKGGVVNVKGTTYIGYDMDKKIPYIYPAVVNVKGDLKIGNDISIGYLGKAHGYLNILNGGKVSARNAFVAPKGESLIATVTIGVTTPLTADPSIYISKNNKGELKIQGENSELNLSGSLYTNHQDAKNPSVGKIYLLDGGILRTKGILRYAPITEFTIDRGIIQLKSAVNHLFANFDNLSPVTLNAGGVTFDTQNFAVNVFDKAQFIGVGSVRKIGAGTLTLPSAGALWQGETRVEEGTLKFAGDYTAHKAYVAKDALLDVEGDFTMNPDDPVTLGVGGMTSYGKVHASGKIQVANGKLIVDVSQGAALDDEGKLPDVFKGEMGREGELASDVVTTNSQLFRFQPEYRDNAVDLVVKVKQPDPEPPKVDPVPKPEEPEEPKPPVQPEKPTPQPEPNPPAPQPEPPAPQPEPPAPQPEPPTPQPEPPTPQPQGCNSVQSCVAEQHNWLASGAANVLDKLIIANPTSNLARKFIPLTSGKAVSDAATETLPLHFGGVNQVILDNHRTFTLALKRESLERSLWVKLLANHQYQDESLSYKARHRGVIIGGDRVNGAHRVGVAASYSQGNIHNWHTTAAHDSRVNSWQLYGYGDHHLSDNSFIDWQLGFGGSRIHGKRQLSFAQAVAKADYSANHWQAGLGANYQIGSPDNHLTPFARLDYAAVQSRGYRETGADALNLVVQKQRQQELVAKVGANLNKAVSEKWAFNGEVSLGYDLLNEPAEITAAFAADPTRRFTLRHQSHRLQTAAAVGVRFNPTENVELKAQFQSKWKRNYREQGGNVVLKWVY